VLLSLKVDKEKCLTVAFKVDKDLPTETELYRKDLYE
jgi:hypothetical protein